MTDQTKQQSFLIFLFEILQRTKTHKKCFYFYSAHGGNQWPNSINGPIDSLYQQMVDLNKCGHRDFQNIAVNGGSSGNMHEIMHGLARNKTLDYPMVVVLALIGNDVCNG